MKRWLLCLALMGGCLLVTAGVAVALDPIVTGDLAVYYSFDEEWTDVVTDGSGNGIDGEVQVDGRVYRTTNGVRPDGGEGAAVFDPLGYFLPAVDPETIDPTAYPDDAILMGTENPPGWGPAVTLAAWLNLTRYSNPGGNGTVFCDPSCAKDTAMGIIQIKSAAGSYVTHFQVNSDGKLRGHLRGEFQSENIANTQVWFNGDPTTGDPYPQGEWFHYAQTYDSNATFGGIPGDIRVYINGQKVFETAPLQGVDDPGNIDLGGWGMGGFLGRVEDDNRQLNGYMDEMYIFTRALSEEEMFQLYDVGGGCDLGDVNMDGAVNGLDVAPFVTLVTGGTFQCEADMNEDGAVNGLDVAPLVAAIVGGGAAAVPEPSTILLAGLGLLGLVWCGRRRR